MEKTSTFQERFLLTLDSDSNSELIRSVLRSPLGLAHSIIDYLFRNEFNRIKQELDSIKGFVAGITRAELLGKDYLLANFYPQLFAFHQFFHSSYRARQGKTLEEFIKEVLRETNPSLTVPDKLNDKINVMANVFKGYNSKGDIDVIAQNKDKVMAVQLRSNVNTGGTTAKASLVEAFRKILSLPKIKKKHLFYHIGVWEKEGSQKKISKDKFYDSLEHYLVPLKISKDNFIKNIEKGIIVKPHITLKLSFGTTEILNSIKDWLGHPKNLKEWKAVSTKELFLMLFCSPNPQIPYFLRIYLCHNFPFPTNFLSR